MNETPIYMQMMMLRDWTVEYALERILGRPIEINDPREAN